MRKVEVGEQLPPFVRETGLANWNRFAAVNDEFVPIHMDDEAGRAAGFDGAFGMGNLQWSFLHNAIRQWMGDDGDILEVRCTFRGTNLKGQTVTAAGVVTAVRDEPGRTIADLEVWTETENGDRLVPGTASVAFPRP